MIVCQHNHVFGNHAFPTIFTERLQERLAPNDWLRKWAHARTFTSLKPQPSTLRDASRLAATYGGEPGDWNLQPPPEERRRASADQRHATSQSNRRDKA